MRIKFMLAFVLSTISIPGVFAHAIWIEANPKGKTGQRQQVKIFFGEYAEGERDSVANWFSNLRDIKLELTEPGGEKKLISVKPEVMYIAAGFVPGKAGIYTVSITHTVKDIYGTSKIEYYAMATVKVDGATNGYELSRSSTSLSFDACSDDQRTGKRLSLKAFYRNNSLADGKVSVAAPSGWEKSFTADNSGVINFVPAWPGLYLAKAFYTDNTPGSHNGKEYKSVMHIVTYGIYVD